MFLPGCGPLSREDELKRYTRSWGQKGWGKRFFPSSFPFYIIFFRKYHIGWHISADRFHPAPNRAIGERSWKRLISAGNRFRIDSWPL